MFKNGERATCLCATRIILRGKIKSNVKRKTVVEFLRMVGTCEEIGGSKEQG